MGKIKKILENELVGGTQTTDVYPVTSTKAVYDENNERLDNILGSLGDKIGIFKNAGYLYAGVATLTTNPGVPDTKVFYIANGKGTYTNFGGIEVTEDDVVVLYYDTAWHKVSTGIATQAKLSELESETKELITNQSASGHPYYMIVDGYFDNYDAASKTVRIFSQYKGGKLKLYRVNGGERIFAKTSYKCPIYILKDFNFDKSTYTKVDGYNLGFVAELTEGTQGSGQFEYIIPSEIEKDSYARTIFIKHMEDSQKAYDELVDVLIENKLDKKYPTWIEDTEDEYMSLSSEEQLQLNQNIRNLWAKNHKKEYSAMEKEAIEDARYVFPNACETKMVVTMNARSLYNFFSERCCNRAQWEIRELADLMLVECEKVAPILFSNCGAPCATTGKCPEGKMSCGTPKTKKK